MTPITRQDILAHQAVVPWAAQYQIEQDLLLCRTMVALFDDGFLRGQIAMRGGTLLHKVHLEPAARYSEDIDLVVVGDRPEEHIRRAIRRVLKGVLGTPKASAWDSLFLAIRNTVKPSRVLRLTYAVRSIIEPGRVLEIVVAANVTEREPHRPVVEMPFGFPFRGKEVRTQIKGLDIHEMLGTKMRALFQRRRGRDLFDLYWARTQAQPPVDPMGVIESFGHYLTKESSMAGREDVISLLRGHLEVRGFPSDMEPLLRQGIEYDPQSAGRLVIAEILLRLLE